MFYIIRAATDDLCHWVDEERVWTNGVKAQLNIQLDKEYEAWDVTFAFPGEVASFHAWKGDLESVNSTVFRVHSTCYNQHCWL